MNRKNIEMSYYEKKVFNYLKNKKIPFQREYTTNTLINDNGNNLYLDFYIEKCKLAIEVNGLHHYQAVDTYSGDSEYKFQRQLINDNIKREWCVNNNIELIEFDVRKGIKKLIKLISTRINNIKNIDNPFLSIEYRLFNIKQLNDAEIILLSFILSHQKQNKDFYYTNEQLSSYFNGRYTVKYIEKILKNLSKLEFITRITTKQYYSENNKWGNRRIIKINLDNLINSL